MLRHNAIRDMTFEFADPALMVQLRRPADVFIDGAAATTPLQAESGILEKLALDVKVINALGQGHADPTEVDPCAVMDKYYAEACALQDTARRCASQGITYMPLVFTAQGGVGRHAEHIISRIATLIGERDGGKAADIKAQFVKRVGCELARHAVRAISRREVRHKT